MNEAVGPSIFPNPGTSHFTLQLPGGVHTIEVSDTTGRRVLNERTSLQQPTIGTANLAPGLYHVRVDDGPPLRWVKQ